MENSLLLNVLIIAASDHQFHQYFLITCALYVGKEAQPFLVFLLIVKFHFCCLTPVKKHGQNSHFFYSIFHKLINKMNETVQKCFYLSGFLQVLEPVHTL